MADRQYREGRGARTISDRTNAALRTLCLRGDLRPRSTYPSHESEWDDIHHLATPEEEEDPSESALTAGLYDAFLVPPPPVSRPFSLEPWVPRWYFENTVTESTAPSQSPERTPVVSTRPPSATTRVTSTSLSRQHSLRRPHVRSRTMDFTDFTSRRRSGGRSSFNEDAEAGSGSNLGMNFPSIPTPPSDSERPGPNFDAVRDAVGYDTRELSNATPAEADAMNEALSIFRHSPPPLRRFGSVQSPRLRRGGIRAPEMTRLSAIQRAAALVEGTAPDSSNMRRSLSPVFSTFPGDQPPSPVARRAVAPYRPRSPTPEPNGIL